MRIFRKYFSDTAAESLRGLDKVWMSGEVSLRKDGALREKMRRAMEARRLYGGKRIAHYRQKALER